MTDNAFAYTKNRSLRQLLHRRTIDHLKTRPYTPPTNGKVERYQLEWTPSFGQGWACGPSRFSC